MQVRNPLSETQEGAICSADKLKMVRMLTLIWTRRSLYDLACLIHALGISKVHVSRFS